MEELKKLCADCKEERDIIEIVKDSQGTIFKLSCGHKIIEDEFTDVITISDQLKDKVKRPGIKKPIIEGMERTKISGKTERPTKESILVDRENQKYIHKVWEKNEKGELELVHEEEIPLSHKGKEYLISKEKKCPKCGSINVEKTGGSHKLQAQAWHHGFKCLDCDTYFWITESNLKP